MIRRDQLRDLCNQYGGQIAVAKRLKCSKDHISRMVSGYYPITDRASRKILEAFPDFALKYPSWQLIEALNVISNDQYSKYLADTANDALNAMGKE